MAAVATSADQTSDLMQKLSLDSQTKSQSDVTKKVPSVQRGTEVASWQVPFPERSVTPVMPGFLDPSMCYANGHAAPAYYYGVNEWEEYPRYLSPGLEMTPHGVYGDMYHGYAYAAYGGYAPGTGVPTMGNDGQLYAPQQYPYTGAYYQPNTPTYPSNPSAKPPQSNAATSSAPENPPLPVDKVKGNSDSMAGGNTGNGNLPSRPAQKNTTTPKGSYNRGSVPGVVPPSYYDQMFGYDSFRSPNPWSDSSVMADVHNRRPAVGSTNSSNTSHASSMSASKNSNFYPPFMGSHPMGTASPAYSRAYANTQVYGQYSSALRNRRPFGSNTGDLQNGRGWLNMDGRYNVGGRGITFYGYGNENMEVLNELNRGPRSGRFKNTQNLSPDVIPAAKDQNLPSGAKNEDSSLIPNRDQYNREDFPDNYPDAKFFVIKSYSEDDIHKSIKYGVWASTPNGNKKLDDAYKEAQEKASKCPIFLLFSVNTSGQFVGVAEMTGPVDFNKTVEYWQQDKWNGCFSVKWHIVKDVPNGIFKHIILENNESKPVTNSRDTQEVKLEQGNQMLKLFKDHVSRTSVLDDFGFYETRQKIMQAKRTKQQFQKQVWDGKTAPTLADISIADVANAKQKLQKSWESSPVEEAAC